MRIPQNKIIPNKQTSGKELMYKDIQKEYQGSYYIIGNQYFAGTKFNPSDPELVKIEAKNINVLLAQASTFTYGQLNTNKSIGRLITTFKIPNFNYKATSNDVENGYIVRYFCKQLNVTPILIKEIDESTYTTIKDNPTYQIVSLKYYLLTNDTKDGNFLPEDLVIANSQMSGLMAFLSS